MSGFLFNFHTTRDNVRAHTHTHKVRSGLTHRTVPVARGRISLVLELGREGPLHGVEELERRDGVLRREH